MTSAQDRPGWAVASPHSSASAAAADVLRAGGNAVDAALAAAAVLTVVYPHQCSIGGDAFALVGSPDGAVDVVNGSGRAPASVEPDEVRRTHRSMPVSGALPVTVPGVLGAWDVLASRWGSLPLADAVHRAAVAAADGVAVSPGLARELAHEADLLARDPGARAVFLPDGQLLTEGSTLRQPQLARSLESVAATGVGAFYDGELGRSVVATLAAAGGRMTVEDLRDHVTDVEAPVSAGYGDVSYLTSGANSQGVFFLEGLGALAVLAERAGRPLDPRGPDAGKVGRILSAAAWHRDTVLGDPRHTHVPVEWLLSREHAEDLAALAEDGHAGGAGAAAAGRPPAARAAQRRSGDTVAIVCADGDGQWISLIQSVFHAFGSGVLDPGTGIVLHNRGASFSLEPGVPNAFGPGRRPLHTLMPLLAARDGAVVGAFGTMGGRAQHQVHTHLALHLAAGRSAAEAVSAPRWIAGRMGAGEPELGATRTVSAESDVPPAAVDSLRAAGFTTHQLPPRDDGAGHAQVVRLDAAGTMTAATDPRADGAALVAPR